MAVASRWPLGGGDGIVALARDVVKMQSALSKYGNGVKSLGALEKSEEGEESLGVGTVISEVFRGGLPEKAPLGGGGETCGHLGGQYSQHRASWGPHACCAGRLSAGSQGSPAPASLPRVIPSPRGAG